MREEAALGLLDKIFNLGSIRIPDFIKLDILVIGAGNFPSFIPFVKGILNTSRSIRNINFVFIEPNKSATDVFEKNYKTHSQDLFSLTIKYKIKNIGAKEYLRNTNEKFDLIYFEHPDISIYEILACKLRLTKNSMKLSLQESVPYLRNVIKDQLIVVATCVFKDDLKNLIKLLKLSFQFKNYQSYKQCADGQRFSQGFIGFVNAQDVQNNKPVDQLTYFIRSANNWYFLAVILSIIVFLLTPSNFKLISLFLVVAQLLNHDYTKSMAIKRAVIIIIQVMVLLAALNYKI